MSEPNKSIHFKLLNKKGTVIAERYSDAMVSPSDDGTVFVFNFKEDITICEGDQLIGEIYLQ